MDIPRCFPALAFAACLAASTVPAHARSANPKHLDRIDPPVRYVLPHDVVVEGYRITYTLRAGDYTARFEGSRGRYLTGEGLCVHLDIHTPKVTGTNDWTCGIYVPEDPALGAEFFTIRPESDVSYEMGLIVAAIIKHGFGSFDFPDKATSMELREALVAAPTDGTVLPRPCDLPPRRLAGRFEPPYPITPTGPSDLHVALADGGITMAFASDPAVTIRATPESCTATQVRARFEDDRGNSGMFVLKLGEAPSFEIVDMLVGGKGGATVGLYPAGAVVLRDSE